MARKRKGKSGYCTLISGSLEYEEVKESGVGTTYRITKPSGKVVVLPAYMFDLLFDIVSEAEEEPDAEEEGGL